VARTLTGACAGTRAITDLSGNNFPSSDRFSNVAVLDADDAAANKLSAGSTITLSGTNFHVIGIVSQPQGAGTIDIYIPLGPPKHSPDPPTARTSTGR